MDIDFLQNKKDKTDKTSSEKNDKRDAVEWTSPAGVKHVSDSANKKDDFAKNKEKNGGPGLLTRSRRDEYNMKKLNKSRKEILKLINAQKDSGSPLSNSNTKGKKDKKRDRLIIKEEKKKLKIKKKRKPRGLFLWLAKLFNKENKNNKKNFGIESNFQNKKELLFDDKEKRVHKDIKDNKIKDQENINNSKKAEDNKEWKTPDILKTNLIKDNLIVFFSWSKNVIFLIISIIFSFIIVGGVYYGLIWNEEKKIDYDYGFEKKFDQINKQIKESEKYIYDNKIEELKKKLNLANILLSKHVYWTNFFDYLEQNTLSDVYYLGFSGSISGQYNINSRTKRFNIIEAQVKQFLLDKYTISAVVRKGVINERENTKSNKDYNNVNEIGYNIGLTLDTSIFTDYKAYY